MLCRDVYHCTPDELEQIEPRKIMAHLAILGIEAEVMKRSSKHG